MRLGAKVPGQGNCTVALLGLLHSDEDQELLFNSKKHCISAFNETYPDRAYE